MDKDDIPGNLNPVIGESVREIENLLNELVGKKETGIPDLVRKLEAAGHAVEISVSVDLRWGAVQEKPPADEPGPLVRIGPLRKPSPAELQAASEMGISLEEVEEMDAAEPVVAYEAVVQDLREKAPKLSPEVRNWVCEYVSHAFPELKIEIPGQDFLTDDGRWLRKLGDMVARLMTLTNPQKRLEALLSHIKRREHE